MPTRGIHLASGSQGLKICIEGSRRNSTFRDVEIIVSATLPIRSICGPATQLSQLRRQRPVASSIASSSSPSFVVAEPASCTPTDRPESNQAYYENEYVQGFTINLPSDAALSEMKRPNFANTDKCFSYYISVLLQLSLKPGSRGAV